MVRALWTRLCWGGGFLEGPHAYAEEGFLKKRHAYAEGGIVWSDAFPEKFKIYINYETVQFLQLNTKINYF